MKNPFALILCFLALTTTYAQEAKFAWMKQIKGDAVPVAMKVDAERNLYIAGSFSGQVDFDPGDSTQLFKAEGGGGDMFILKLDSVGNFVWLYEISRSKTSVNIYDIVLDPSGNIFAIGVFGSANGEPEVDFDPGPGVATIGQYDVFVLKLRADGSFAWVRKQPATYIYKSTYSIAVDKRGNVYSTGSFFGTVDVDPGEGVFNLSGDDETKEIFISKLDSSGNFVWGKQTQTRYWDNYTRSGSLSVDTSGNVYLTGTFRTPMDVDPGPDTVLLIPRDSVLSVPGKSINSFVLKLDTAGNFVWARHIMPDIGSETQIKALAVDRTGATVITGFFSGRVDFDNDNPEYTISADGPSAFIARIDTVGAIEWVKEVNSTLSIEIPSITTDTAGNVYTTGYFSGLTEFAPAGSSYSLTTDNGVAPDIFIYKLNAQGKHGWLKQIGSGNYDWGLSIAVGREGTVYTTGIFRDTVDFDPGPDMFKSIAPKNVLNMYVHAMKQVVSPVSVHEDIPDNTLAVHTVSGELLLQLPIKNMHDDVQISLYSIGGDVLKAYSAQGGQRVAISLKGFATGQYILRIVSGEDVFVKTVHHIQ